MVSKQKIKFPKKVDEPFSLALTLFLKIFQVMLKIIRKLNSQTLFHQHQANGIKENNAKSKPEETALTVDIEIICIGNELLIGKIKDTNAHYLAKQATQLGANVNE